MRKFTRGAIGTGLSLGLAIAGCSDNREQTEFQKFQMDALKQSGHVVDMDLGPTVLDPDVPCRPTAEQLATNYVVQVRLVEPATSRTLPGIIRVTGARVYRDAEGSIEAYCGENATPEDMPGAGILPEESEIVLPVISACLDDPKEFQRRTGIGPEEYPMPCYSRPLVFDMNNPEDAGAVQILAPVH